MSDSLRNVKKCRANPANLRKFVLHGQAVVNIEYNHIAPFHDNFFLHQKYTVEGLSLRQIAAETFSSKSTIQQNLTHFGIKLRRRSRELHSHNDRASQAKYGTKKSKGRLIRHVGEERIIRAVI